MVFYKLNGKNPFESVNMQVASKLRKWEMETTVVPVAFGALGTFQRTLTTTWRESTSSQKHELFINQPRSKMQIFSLIEVKVTSYWAQKRKISVNIVHDKDMLMIMIIIIITNEIVPL